MKENENSTGKSYDQERFGKMQILLSRILLYGVLASTSIVIFGLILMAVTNSTGYSCDLKRLAQLHLELQRQCHSAW